MAKIKGWTCAKHMDDNDFGWFGINGIFLWIEKDEDKYIIKRNFGSDIGSRYNTISSARKVAVNWMKAHPKG